VDPDEAAAGVFAFALQPILRAHEHAEPGLHLVGVGDHMDLVSPQRQRVGRPVLLHTDPALDRREFANHADSHSRTSRTPSSSKPRNRSTAAPGSHTPCSRLNLHQLLSPTTMSKTS